MTRNKPTNVIPTVYVNATERDSATGKRKTVSTTLYETTAQEVIDFLNSSADRGAKRKPASSALA